MKNIYIILLFLVIGFVSNINGYWFQYFEISNGTCSKTTEVETGICTAACDTIFQFSPMLSPGGINIKQYSLSDSSCTNQPTSTDYLFCTEGDYAPRTVGSFSIVCQNTSQIPTTTTSSSTTSSSTSSTSINTPTPSNNQDSLANIISTNFLMTLVILISTFFL